MKMIVLGGGNLLVKRIRISKGMTAADFVASTVDGAAILEKMKERSARIRWADDFGAISWVDSHNNLLNWFLTNEAA
jgi:hypothetical protein